MDPLATVDDLTARSPRALTTDELVRAEALLEDASANVRRVSAQQFTPGTSTVILPVRRGRVRLPQRPVTAVTSVQTLTGTDIAHRVAGNDIRLDLDPINAWEVEPFRCKPEEVEVVYDHGDETVPPLVVGIVCSVVLRALGTDPTQTGITQESIDGYSVSTGTIGAAGAVGLLPSEEEALREFRRPAGPIRTRA